MPREKACYRDILARIDAAFPNVQMLNQKNVASFTGLHRRTIFRKYNIGRSGTEYVAKEDLERLLAM